LEVDIPTRNEVLRFLHHVTGPAVGLPALQDLFRNVPRCILEDLLRRYRKVWQTRYAQHGFELMWHYAGAVWAIDFTKPREPIDGVFPYLLAIRDLAIHCQLAWRPVRSESVADVLPTLWELFAEQGPPLVLKSDNGSAFIAEALHALLGETLVAQLFSPVHQPQYNGALERNNGVLKVYTHQHAVSVGHPFRWTAEDVEHAQQLANTISRPWGARRLSPEQAWHGRAPITAEARQAFGAALDAHRAWAAHELALDLAAELSVADRARLDRLAISGALQELGYLTLQRRGHIERPQRLSREELAKRVAKFRGAQPASESAVTEPMVTAPMVTEPTVAKSTMAKSTMAKSTMAKSTMAKSVVAKSVVARSVVARSAVAKSMVAECQVAENSTPVPSPEPVTAEACDSRAPLLASSASSDILQAASAVAPAPQEFPQEISSAHRERTFTSWLRRAFTPLLQLCKTAKISQ